jgi:hypothetical protein
MPSLDWEPTFAEIEVACGLRYGMEYDEAAWLGMNSSWLFDVEHAMEQELFCKKRLQAEAEDAITCA